MPFDNITNIFTKTLSRKLIAMFVILGLLIIAVVGYVSYSDAQTAIREGDTEKLESVNEALSDHIVTKI